MRVIDSPSSVTDMLRQQHPPTRVQGSEERSQALNEAYGMLTEMSARELASYERELRVRGPRGSNLKCATACVRCFGTQTAARPADSAYVHMHVGSCLHRCQS